MCFGNSGIAIHGLRIEFPHKYDLLLPSIRALNLRSVEYLDFVRREMPCTDLSCVLKVSQTSLSEFSVIELRWIYLILKSKGQVDRTKIAQSILYG